MIKVVVDDRMQSGYVYYRTAAIGRDFASGFTPDLTPRQMLALGLSAAFNAPIPPPRFGVFRM